MKKFFHKLLGTGFALLLMVGAIFAMSLSANAATTSVSIGGVTLNSGEYLPTGQTTKTTTKPSGGYAYFNNGVLTLHNYELNTVKEIKTVVEGALTLTLSGTSTVTYTGSSSALYVGGNLTVSGNGKLIINATAEKYSDGIFCSGGMIFQSGTMEVKANDDAIYADGLELMSGTITVNSERIGVRLQKDSTFSGGKLIVNAKDDGIQNTGNLDICGTDVTITAGGYGIKVDQYISKVTIRGASDVRIDSKHTGILCQDIIVTDLNAKVVISGESKAAVEFFSKQFDSDLAITVSKTADGSEATNYYGTLGGYKYLYLRMPDLYVCGVPMALGDYYRDSCSAATTYAYSYGYAHAQLNGERTELTLYRFAKGGKGNTPAIHSPGSLLLILDGDNYISSENAPTIKLDNGFMQVLSRSSTDEGRLFITAKGSDGIQLSKGGYYQTSGIINIAAQAAGVNVYDKEVSVTGGKLDVVGNARALSCGKINYGNLQIKATQAASGALGNYSGSYMNKYKHIVIADHFCTGVLHPARESSCTTAGKQAYYECSCGRYYEDAACLVEIGTLYLWGVIPETGHTPKDGWAVNEKSHYKVCKVCNAQINDTAGLHYGGKATCQQKANCTICDVEYGTVNENNHSSITTLKAVAATCSKTGLTQGEKCTDCGTVTVAQNTVAKKAHTYKSVTTKATLTKNGKVETKCTGCGYVSKTTTVYYPKTIKLSKTSYTYNGKVQKPSVTVKDSKGNTISSSHYTVTYPSGMKNAGTYKVKITFKGNYSGTKTLSYTIKPIDVSKCKITLSATSYTYNGSVKKPAVTVKNASGTKLTTSSYTVTYASGRKNVGKYKVTVKMKGNYTGTKTLYFTINPAKTTVKSLTAGSKKLTVNITKKSAQVTGYQIQYSTSKSFESYKTKTVSSYKTTKATLSSLKAKTTYYVRVRTYKTVNGTKYYSGWSEIKYKKTK